MKRVIQCGALIIAGMMTVIGSPVIAQSSEPGPRQQYVSAPYAEGNAEGSCNDVSGLPLDAYTATCQSELATANASNGEIHFDLRATSPQDGTLPGIAFAHGSANMDAIHEITAPANAFLFDASLSIANVVSDVQSVGLSRSEMTARVDIIHTACPNCRATSSQPLATSDSGSVVHLLGVMTNPSGAPVPAGTAKITLRLLASATLAGLGEIAAVLDATLTQIEVASPSVERVLGAPYLTAQGGRSCMGSMGTTFMCRSTAARTTGRIEMDLGVLSPVAGTAPGSGDAFGFNQIGIDVRPSEPVRGAAYILTLRVKDAESFSSVTSPVVGSASAHIDAVVSIEGISCPGCVGTAADQVVGFKDSRLDEDMDFVVWTTSETGLPTSPQLLNAVIALTGQARINNAAGETRTWLSGTVAAVRIVELA